MRETQYRIYPQRNEGNVSIYQSIERSIVIMNGYFVNLWNKLFPKPTWKYSPKVARDIIEAAIKEECDPSKIFYCPDCDIWHRNYK